MYESECKRVSARVSAESESRERERERGESERATCKNVDTHWGAFGPGADPKRSKAAYPPPRCVLDHKLNGCILSCEYTKLIVFALD